METTNCAQCGKAISGQGINFSSSGTPVCDACVAGAMVKGGPLASREYEFDAMENETLSTLASPMRFVGVLSVVFGVLQMILGLVNLKAGMAALVQLGEGLALAAVGGWVASAATSLREVVMTEGSDITNLMIALRKLRSAYRLQAWLMGLACALVVLLILMVLVAK